ncbi:MAG: 5'/3'-nucleotidase SurE [Chloroflexota bacterium]|nr:5'/3'-nucleotidase SurE [Chloroflexota bacterium]
MAPQRPHVLVTNDDGIRAPGLLALKKACTEIGKVTVLAPSHNWSASGHVKTMHKPLRVDGIVLADDTPALSTSGAPSDAVALAFLGLVEEPIDLVISGVNSGASLGHDVTYSGTVTAAMEATIAGTPAIAVSLNSRTDDDFTLAARFAASLGRQILEHGLPRDVLLNVSVPSLPADEIAGVQVTRMGLRVYHDQLVRRLDPRGKPYYWIGGPEPTGVEEEGTDIWAIAHDIISVTPVQLDLTAHDLLESFENWDLKPKYTDA